MGRNLSEGRKPAVQEGRGEEHNQPRSGQVQTEKEDLWADQWARQTKRSWQERDDGGLDLNASFGLHVFQWWKMLPVLDSSGDKEVPPPVLPKTESPAGLGKCAPGACRGDP